ncbi:hypothetical protein A2867_00065 [Candidatus Daviesbacteria bacterium RIFCSPHIGHO2_01_FULL_40_11]|uniref:Uncharacterized protein n=1 Tax=Candidatus Daviesbacteria bacterium RIFCSPHIGHO2_01_FULL_40_11 TaxID=1797762 RepID=A0A1F5JKD4_9BACT|nr:MAG: hypothetical protein A2867_00065 [Candidatus Daviesbacteria bacterium RIFCSPHIGHO2_01_FULL_40_11]
MDSERRYSLDKQERVIKGEPWNRFFNPVVMEVFSDYYKKGGHLFGITGDLDNLGVFVARNGRPKAENLVDLYNQTIRNFLENWAIENKDSLISMAFVPSGEEVLIIGLAKNKSAPLQLFEKIRDGTMSLTKSQSFLDIGDTAASFGGVIFGNEYDNGITEMVNAVQEGEPDSRVYPLYAALLEKIRQEMAIALDKQKFCDILEGNFPIEMRQLVLSRLLLYKKTTREIIIALNSLSPEEIKHILEVVGNAYGVSHGQEDVINKLIKDLSLDQQFHQ